MHILVCPHVYCNTACMLLIYFVDDDDVGDGDADDADADDDAGDGDDDDEDDGCKTMMIMDRCCLFFAGVLT